MSEIRVPVWSLKGWLIDGHPLAVPSHAGRGEGALWDTDPPQKSHTHALATPQHHISQHHPHTNVGQETHSDYSKIEPMCLNMGVGCTQSLRQRQGNDYLGCFRVESTAAL